MRKIALIFAIMFSVSGYAKLLSKAPLSQEPSASGLLSSQSDTVSQGLFSLHSRHSIDTGHPDITPSNLGAPIFIQLFKEERQLELYIKVNESFQLVRSFPICKFSGGLGPKKIQGDFKSPEGFYRITSRQLNPDSHYYRAINLGFPNQYDKQHGYSGTYLMIHGDCVSIGCYAMTNAGIEQIYHYAQAALSHGQSTIDVNIFPFKMTEQNMRRHANSSNIGFWRQLKPGYDFFVKYHQPPAVTVFNGFYQIGNSASLPTSSFVKASLPFNQSS